MGVCLARSECTVCELDGAHARAVEESSECPVWFGMLVLKFVCEYFRVKLSAAQSANQSAFLLGRQEKCTQLQHR